MGLQRKEKEQRGSVRIKDGSNKKLTVDAIAVYGFRKDNLPKVLNPPVSSKEREDFKALADLLVRKVSGFGWLFGFFVRFH
jgi:hypothetical protein